jgi:hypothetical protein
MKHLRNCANKKYIIDYLIYFLNLFGNDASNQSEWSKLAFPYLIFHRRILFGGSIISKNLNCCFEKNKIGKEKNDSN